MICENENLKNYPMVKFGQAGDDDDDSDKILVFNEGSSN